jgi:hypothetical protein
VRRLTLFVDVLSELDCFGFLYHCYNLDVLNLGLLILHPQCAFTQAFDDREHLLMIGCLIFKFTEHHTAELAAVSAHLVGDLMALEFVLLCRQSRVDVEELICLP